MATFDWCTPSRGDREHDRCSLAYRRSSDGELVVCSCPNHTPEELAAAAARQPVHTTPPPVVVRGAGKGTTVRRDVPLRTYECDGKRTQATSATAAAAQLGVSRRHFRAHGRELATTTNTTPEE